MNLAPATLALLIANVLAFLGQMLVPQMLEMRFALWPTHERFEIWQLVTYAFLHGGLLHIVFNMFGLVMFGNELERVFGTRRFLVFYFASVVSASLVQLMVNDHLGQVAPTVGASGGVFGLVLGFAWLFPERRIMLIFPPIPMPARVFALVFAGLELYLGFSRPDGGVAHFAHLGGMLGALLLLLYWRSKRRLR